MKARACCCLLKRSCHMNKALAASVHYPFVYVGKLSRKSKYVFLRSCMTYYYQIPSIQNTVSRCQSIHWREWKRPAYKADVMFGDSGVLPVAVDMPASLAISYSG